MSQSHGVADEGDLRKSALKSDPGTEKQRVLLEADLKLGVDEASVPLADA